jgi:hypothetical protein
MAKRFFLGGISFVALAIALFGSVGESGATFHIMRIEGVMAGFNGDTTDQYVELRMVDGLQNQVGTHVICFFDASGAPYARFKFPSNVTGSAAGSSILIGTVNFDRDWAAGAPNFTFGPATTTAIASGADVDHPIRAPSGWISFGSDSQNTPSLMCQAGFFLVDSVAYGTGYTGPVDYGTKLNSDLPSNSSNGIHLTGQFCSENSFANSCTNPPDNSVDYSIVDLNSGSNQPRNNAGQQGPLNADFDSDGVLNGSDNCPNVANPGQADGDTDTVGDACDNCPSWANPSQAALPWTVPADDADCDGFRDTTSAANSAQETAIGTDPIRHCASTGAQDDEPTPDAWPVDFNDNRLVNGQDVSKFGPAYNKTVANGPYGGLPGARYDFTGNGIINGQDIAKFASFYNKNCL